MKRRTNVWLDDDDRESARLVAKHYGLDSISAALRFAANELARRIRSDKDTDQDTIGAADPDMKTTT